MAKLDEKDPRWVVDDLPDGANVGGWHWSEKDVTKEAWEEFRKMLGCRPLYEAENVKIRLLEVRKVEGEAISLNRKGKKGLFFDFDYTLEWHGEILDRYGYETTNANGTIQGNVDQETITTCEMEVALESLQSPGSAALLACVQSKGIPAIRNLLSHFFEAIRARYDPLKEAELRKQLQIKKEQEAVLLQQIDIQRVKDEEEQFLKDSQMGQSAEDTTLPPEEGCDTTGMTEMEIQNELSRQRMEKYKREQEEARRREKEERRKAAPKMAVQRTDEELLAFLNEDEDGAAVARKVDIEKQNELAKKRMEERKAEAQSQRAAETRRRKSSPVRTGKTDEELLAYLMADD